MDKNKCPKMKSQFTFWKRFRDRLNTIWKLLKDGGLQNNIFRNYLKKFPLKHKPVVVF